MPLAQVFISYRHVEPDQSLAAELADSIGKQHQVFIDNQTPLGKEWGDVIEEHLGSADFLTALVSENATKSPMVLAEIEKAHRLNVATKRPGIIPIRLNFDGEFRYPLSAYVNRFQQCVWSGPEDTPRVTELLLKTLGTRSEGRRPASQRHQMIKRVRTDWVQGVLEKSLYQAARIELGLKTQPGAVERGMDVLIQRPEEEPQLLAPGTGLLRVFDDQLGQLLILGAPGSGKTTLLLELARELLDRASHDENHPIPVVFNLSSWTQRPLPLAEWMAQELRLRSDVPRKLAAEWIEREQILPLLDGLDEVAENKRQECVEAINAYRIEHGWVQLAVCSRVAEYEALTAKLRLPGAVAVQPLTRSQIEEYLAFAGQHLQGVWHAVEKDDGLWELLETPLMISIVALAYKDCPVDSIVHKATTMQTRRDQLFAAYLREMLKRRTKETRFTAEQLRRWLSWLAARMMIQGQTMFQVEDIRSSWVGWRRAEVIVTACIVTIATVLSGIFGWINFSSIDFVNLEFKKSFFNGDAPYLLLFMAPVGLVHALIRARSAAPAEILRPHWPGAKNFIATTIKSAVLGGMLGYVLGAVGCAASSFDHGWRSEDLIDGAQMFGPAGIVAFGFLGAIGSLVSARVASVRGSPNLALYNSVRNSLICFGAASLLCLPAVVALAKGNLDGWLMSACLGVALLGWIGWFAALEKGGYFLLNHLITRYLLHRRSLVSLHLVRFLETAAERLFLRRVGGGYIFIHRSLMEYFAKDFK